jgi:signal transduction histidine kinase
VTGPDGRIAAVNPSWTRALGWPAAESLGRTLDEFVIPEERAGLSAALDRLAAGTQPGRDLELELTCLAATSEPRRVLWTIVPEDGLLYGFGRDITEQRHAEEALRQSQKLEAVGQLTGGVAHDFNNLLTIIRSSVEFLRRPELPEARKARYLDAVSDTVDRAAKLTGQLLAFARRQALTPETFDVCERLRGISEMLDSVTGARIRVVTDLPGGACYVRADASQFETALVNMAVNARDAMDGEGTLRLRLDAPIALPPIRGHAGAAGAFVAVSVTDTGSGIASADLMRIFEPFYTTKEVGKGTGLGLSQVIGFAKQSGGDVDVRSQPGAGATFTLYLPEVPAPADAPMARRETVSGGGAAALRVLVVEDNLEVGRFCTQILEDLGHRPVWVENAEAALTALAASPEPFDAVFSDVVMPGMGGIALARLLREKFADLPVVLTSGYSHVLAQDDAHGFDLLRKPYSAQELADMLRQVTET